MAGRGLLERGLVKVGRVLGCPVRPIRDDAKADAALASMTAEQRDGYGIHDDGQVLLPWRVDSDFQERFGAVRNITSLGPGHYWSLLSLAKQQVCRGGNIAECGVYRGSSALLFADLMADAGSSAELHLFDSFAGVSAPTDTVDVVWNGGELAATLTDVQQLLAPHQRRTVVHEGWIPDTFTEVDHDVTFDFVHLDLDLYAPTLASLHSSGPASTLAGSSWSTTTPTRGAAVSSPQSTSSGPNPTCCPSTPLHHSSSP